MSISIDEVKKLQKAFEDDAFVKSLTSNQSDEDIRVCLKEKNVNLTMDAIHDIGQTLRTMNSEGEVSENELEDIAGGIICTWGGVPRGAGMSPLGKKVWDMLRKLF